MTGRERVFGCLGGAPIDRPPHYVLSSLYGARLTGRSLFDHYTDPVAYADGQSAFIEQFDPDIAFAPFALALEGEAWGSELRYTEKGPPVLIRPAQADELGFVAPPDLDSSPALAYLRESTRLLAQRHGGDRVVLVPVLSPVDLPIVVVGDEGWLDLLMFRRDAARRLLDLTTAHFLRWSAALFAAGADVLVVSVSLATQTLVSPEFAAQVAAPALRAAVGAVPGPVLLHHVGGPLLPRLPLLSGLPTVAGYIADDSDDLAAVRAVVGSGVLLASGPDGPGLRRATPASAMEACRAKLIERHADPRFVLGTTCADVERDTDPEVVAVLRAAAVAAGPRP